MAVQHADTIVVGGGLVGAAISYGLAKIGQGVIVLDEGDVAFRASRGNFGLVWVQSKGDGMPEYARWTRRSADLWPEFAGELAGETGVSPHYYKAGGVHTCLSEEELQARTNLIERMRQVHGPERYEARVLDRRELAEMLPGLGEAVIGGSWSPHDGHASPLHLLRALHAGLLQGRGRYHADARVTAIARDGSGYRVTTAAGVFAAERVVLAAGLANRALAPMVGLSAPVSPLKGQILVTERAATVLPMPTAFVRQTEEGTFLMGDSYEDSGFDTASRPNVMAEIARRAARTFPFLRKLQVVRAWAALRVMSGDGFPIYEQSRTHPGAFVVNCHSGVTLAGAHALALAPMIARGRLDEAFAAFSAGRFDVQAHRDVA